MIFSYKNYIFFIVLFITITSPHQATAQDLREHCLWRCDINFNLCMDRPKEIIPEPRSINWNSSSKTLEVNEKHDTKYTLYGGNEDVTCGGQYISCKNLCQSGPQCSTSDQCSGGGACINAKCEDACQSDAQCRIRLKSNDGICIKYSNGRSACSVY